MLSDEVAGLCCGGLDASYDSFVFLLIFLSRFFEWGRDVFL